jgi:4-hydroxy-tetrahydrodipicolinate reductase
MLGGDTCKEAVNMRRIRAIVYGLGTMGRLSVKYLKEKDVDVVAAYVRTVAGKDFSAPELADVEICQAHVPFEKFEADVALLTHCSTLADLEEPALRCARAGLDVVTIAEDAFDPFFEDEELPIARRIDETFRKHGKTLVSVGVQDTFWFAQPLAFSGAVQRLDKIIGRNIADLAALGTGSQHNDFIGLTPTEFEIAIRQKPAHSRRGIFDVALRPFVRALGLNIVSIRTTMEPVIAEADLHIAKFGLTIRSGTTRGCMERVVAELDGGRIAEGQFIMAFLPPGETAYNEWQIQGLPTMAMRTDDFHGDVVTVASLVNRLRDAMDAEPGLRGVDELKPARFHAAFARPA